ncbi:unnamed protein product [Brassica rapa subsp. narinosa]
MIGVETSWLEASKLPVRFSAGLVGDCSEHLFVLGSVSSVVRRPIHAGFGGIRKVRVLVFETSPMIVLDFIDRESYDRRGVHRELATPETSRELPASEATRRISLFRELR